MQMLNQGGNHILLRGRTAGAPQLSHRSRELSYYVFPLEVDRLSLARDLVNVVLPAGLLPALPPEPGAGVEVEGEVRSFNNKSGTGSRLVITVHARELAPWDGPHENLVTLRGALCKPPTLRRTPLGRDICDLMLAVNRRYGRSDYLPCIAWGALAHRCAALSVGDALSLRGRLQSRLYTKQTDRGPEERTAFEVSIMELEP